MCSQSPPAASSTTRECLPLCLSLPPASCRARHSQGRSGLRPFFTLLPACSAAWRLFRPRFGLRALEMHTRGLSASHVDCGVRSEEHHTCQVKCDAPCRAPETGGARLTIALKPATCSSIFAHAHRGHGTCCSSTQKSAGPAGRRPLREARAAPDRAPAVLLSSL